MAVDGHRAADGVELQGAVLNGGSRLPLRTARQGAHARFQFSQLEGLDQIIVRTQVETAHAVLDAVQRGENQHRCGQLAVAQVLQHLESIHAGQTDIENDQIEVLGGQGAVGLAAGIDAIDSVVAGPQGAGQAIGQDGVVFSDQDSHAWRIMQNGVAMATPLSRQGLSERIYFFFSSFLASFFGSSFFACLAMIRSLMPS